MNKPTAKELYLQVGEDLKKICSESFILEHHLQKKKVHEIKRIIITVTIDKEKKKEKKDE